MSKLDELEAMQVAMKLVSERVRQIQEEGWTTEHDDLANDSQLARAAACYAIPPEDRESEVLPDAELWPWALKWWKPSIYDREKELIKSGALIMAEIQRIWRLKRKEWLERFDDIPGFEGRYRANAFGVISLLPWKKSGFMSPWTDKHGTAYIKLRDKSGKRVQFKYNDLLKK